MSINWKLRLKNKATLTTLITTIIAFVYQILGIFDIIPPVSSDSLIQLFGIVITALATLGIIVDPTTSGINDSERALAYTEPNKSTSESEELGA